MAQSHAGAHTNPSASPAAQPAPGAVRRTSAFVHGCLDFRSYMPSEPPAVAGGWSRPLATFRTGDQPPATAGGSDSLTHNSEQNRSPIDINRLPIDASPLFRGQ